jgi:hypothetical protein
MSDYKSPRRQDLAEEFKPKTGVEKSLNYVKVIGLLDRLNREISFQEEPIRSGDMYFSVEACPGMETVYSRLRFGNIRLDIEPLSHIDEMELLETIQNELEHLRDGTIAALNVVARLRPRASVEMQQEAIKETA